MGLLLLSQIIAIVFGFFYTIYMARYLGAEGFGLISFAMAFTSIFAVITDFGLNTVTTREVSRNKCLTLKYINNVILIKIILVIITLLLVIITLDIFKYPQSTLYVVYLFMLSTILSSFVQNFNSIFQSFQKMEYQALGVIVNNTILLCGTFVAIKYSFDVVGFSLIYVTANFIVLIYSVIVYNLKFLKFNFPNQNLIDTQFSINMIKEAFPIFLSALFSVVAFKIDIVMLSIIKGDMIVGTYSASYKLIEILLFLPAAFTISILPIFSKMFVKKRALNILKHSYQFSVKILLSIALPITILIMVFSNDIILFLYSLKYSDSVFVLQILIWTIPPSFLTYVLGTLLVSINKQQIVLKTTIIVTVFNIFMNLILIPYLSYIGAAIVTVLTQFILLIIYYISVSHIFHRIKLSETIIKPVVASLVMLLLLYIALRINNVFMIILAILSYLIVLLKIKTFNTEEIFLFKSLLDK
jgi:O-antigen/teichoic acid export membrane protein